MFPQAQPHDMPLEVAQDVFVVYGSVRLMPLMRITRNMAIVRHAGQLTLINPVRMTDAGLAALDALGKVAHVLRLGPLHGMDDEFYVDRYQASFWAFPDGTTYTTPAITQPLLANGELPFPNARLFVFDHLTETERAILLQQDSGILLTTDAVQSYSTPPHMPHTSGLTQRLLSLVGFPKKTIIGPIWVKKMATDQQGIKAEFERLLTLEFDQLLSGHGTFVPRGAHAELRLAFENMFG